MPGPQFKEIRFKMGSTKNIGPKKYRIKYDVPSINGKRKQKSETLLGVSDKEARAIVAKREELVSNGGYHTDNITISELFEKFMSKKRGLAYNTVNRYEQIHRNYLAKAFGSAPIKHLNRLQLSETYDSWCNGGANGRKICPRTILHVHNLLRGILNWGVRNELITRNIASLLASDELPKSVRPEPRALNEKEVRLFLSAAKTPPKAAKTQGTLSSQPWFYPAAAFATYTGCRRGETLALRWSDVNFDQNVVTICRSLNQNLTFKGTKNSKSRTLSIPPQMVQILYDHKSQQGQERETLGSVYRDSDLVFAMPDGRPVIPRNFGTAIKRLVKRTDIPKITLHDLRDTHASLLAKTGTPIDVLSKRLGHSNINVTMDRYLHVYPERDADAASAFGKLIG